MLSSTSLLHGNCIFNRNNTVATQQGMKTYWLCKSYRITMCRARCITHQGRVISSTGMHNHLPHMKESHITDDLNGGNPMAVTMRLPPVISFSQSYSSSNTHKNHNIVAMSSNQRNIHESNDSHIQSHDVHSNQQNAHHSPVTNQHPHDDETIFNQNMMLTVLHQNNLMQLSSMVPNSGAMQNHAQLSQLNSNNMQQSTPELPTIGALATENRQGLNSSPISSISSVQQQHIPSDLNRISQPYQHSAMHPENQQQNHSQEQVNSVTVHSPCIESSSNLNPNQSQIENDSTVHHPMSNKISHSPSFKLEKI